MRLEMLDDGIRPALDRLVGHRETCGRTDLAAQLRLAGKPLQDRGEGGGVAGRGDEAAPSVSR